MRRRPILDHYGADPTIAASKTSFSHEFSSHLIEEFAALNAFAFLFVKIFKFLLLFHL